MSASGSLFCALNRWECSSSETPARNSNNEPQKTRSYKLYVSKGVSSRRFSIFHIKIFIKTIRLKFREIPKCDDEGENLIKLISRTRTHFKVPLLRLNCRSENVGESKCDKSNGFDTRVNPYHDRYFMRNREEQINIFWDTRFSPSSVTYSFLPPPL